MAGHVLTRKKATLSAHKPGKPQVKVQVIKTFNQAWVRNPGGRFFVFYGGAGSGKSVAVAQRICRILLKARGCRILVARKTLPSLRITAYQLIKDTLSAWKIKYDENKTARIIQVGPNQVYFSGLDDPEKIKSAEFNYVWIEEATDVKKEDFLQVNLRTRRRNADGPNQIYLSFNPIDAHHWLITDIVEGPRKDNTIIHHSTYLDNPYLPQDYVDELESLQERDENFYRIYTLGQPGVLKGLIYQNYDVIPWPAKAGHPTRDADMMGLDFGFNNKMALITIRYIEGEFYLKELFYESEKTTQDLIAWMKKHLHNKNIPIYADAAEPDRIEEIRRAGFNVWPARKEVVPGIDHIKAQILHISSDSPNTIKEFRNYKWREDKDGNTLDEPVKFMDHACDAIRYAIYTAKAGSERVPIEALKSETQIPDMDPWDDYGDYDQDLPF